MAFDFAALKIELTTDPGGLGYAPHITEGRMGELGKLINETRGSIAISRGVIDTHEIFEATDPVEWAALTANEKQRESHADPDPRRYGDPGRQQ